MKTQNQSLAAKKKFEKEKTPPLSEKEKTAVGFDPAYVKLFEKIEHAEMKHFHYNSPYGNISYTFLKREIPYRIDGKVYYDITTAYGYGGPLATEVTNMHFLMEGFTCAFEHYCKENLIVSEFIRFHLMENKNIRDHYHGELGEIGPHISRDLTKSMDQDFSKSLFKTVKKANQSGLRIVTDQTGDHLDKFMELYYSTMDRNNAEKFYYFDKSFFLELHKNLPEKFVYSFVFLEDKVISAHLTLFGDTYAYGFLGGNLQEYFHYDANTFLEYHMIDWLKKKNLSYYTVGGGYRGEDGIYNFKKKFDKKGIHTFYVGKQIYNTDIYKKLVAIREKEPGFDPETSFFPAYRERT